MPIQTSILILLSLILSTTLTFANFPADAKARAVKGCEVIINKDSEALHISCRIDKSNKRNKSVGVSESILSKFPNYQNSVGIRFKVKGETPDNFAIVSAQTKAGNLIVRGYEAGYFVTNEWHEVTLYWDDFVQNNKPWGKGNKGELSIENQKLDINKVSKIGWGRGFQFNNFDKKDWSLSIKDVEFIHQAKAQNKVVEYPKEISRTIGKIKNGEHLNILLLGDSITDYGDDRSHTFFAVEKLKEKYGIRATIFNAGIGGHSVRAGNIVLKRSLKNMPNPDLVVILYGANDCKANKTVGLTAQDFQAQLERFIDRVRSKTNGNADILLVSGVPRLDKSQTKTTGEIETIIDGLYRAAETKSTGLVDSFNTYLQLDPAKRKTLYKDTVHQNENGFIYLGDLIYNYIESQI